MVFIWSVSTKLNCAHDSVRQWDQKHYSRIHEFDELGENLMQNVQKKFINELDAIIDF